MHHPRDARLATGVDDVPSALDVDSLEVGRIAPVLDLRRGVEGYVAAPGAGTHRLAIVEVAADRLRTELAHALRGPL